VLGFTVAFVAPASPALVVEPMIAVTIIAALLAWGRSLPPVNRN
jgi:hypothetical protein